ncbi:hypothetical protein DRN85_04690 [Methanosarcinales archaeon]|nr:MAG: hypothetical protein DRN85_04690 [Methanosarcinales archaeon]
MGFSVVAASAVILIGLITFIGVVTASLLYAINQLTITLNTLPNRDLDVQIELDRVNINASLVQFYVKNKGSKTIFLKNQDFNWNSVIIAYRNNTWHSYLIEDYTVSEIKVQNSTVSFNPSTHTYINPGEEAKIIVSLPADAPNIPTNGTVIIVFISHYGVSAMKEEVRAA